METTTNNSDVVNEHDKTEIKNIKDIDLSKYKVLKEDIAFEELDNGEKEKIKLIYVEKNTKYYENLKKAKDRYIEKNREKVNEQVNERHKKKYHNDPEYREKVLQKRRDYYAKNKK